MIRRKHLSLREQEAAQRLCIALDTQGLGSALDLARSVKDYVGFYKIGKELHTLSERIFGGRAIERICDAVDSKREEPCVFLDLKLHDTPKTVYKSSMACTQRGVAMFDVHVAGGEAMCKEALQGANDAAAKQNIPRPEVLGVTVLSSLNDEDLRQQGFKEDYDDLLRRRVDLACEWGLDGVVCPASKAGMLQEEFEEGLLYVTPGIQFRRVAGEGQKQLITPRRAAYQCHNSVLVVGSAIYNAENRRETAYAILKEIARGMP